MPVTDCLLGDMYVYVYVSCVYYSCPCQVFIFNHVRQDWHKKVDGYDAHCIIHVQGHIHAYIHAYIHIHIYIHICIEREKYQHYYKPFTNIVLLM